MWLVQKIGLDAYGSIDRVQWQEADIVSNKWIGHPHVAVVIAVINEIYKGGVATHFEDLATPHMGPWLRTIVLSGGRETIITDNDRTPGDTRTLFDLPKL